MGGKRGRPPKPVDGGASAQAFFGSELRRLRVDRGLRLADLASRVGYSVQHISAVERGTVAASEQFAAVCDGSLGADGHLVRLLDAVVLEQATARHRRQAARRQAAPAAARVCDGTEVRDDVDWERLEAVTRMRARPSIAMVDDLALITERYRSLYHYLPAPQMLECADAHLSTLRALLGDSGGGSVEQELAVMAQETAGLVAWLRHDLGDLAASEAAYRLADELLVASGDRVLAGYVTAFRAVARSARGNLQASASDLEAAAYQMGTAAPDMPAAWLFALRAEAEAGRGNSAPAMALLWQAEQALDRAGRDPGAAWMYLFDEGRLAAHRGSCLLALGRPVQAQIAFELAMRALPASCLRRRSDLRVKLAMARIALGDCSGAVRLGLEAVDGFVHAGSAQGLRSVRTLRGQIVADHGLRVVSALDERLQVYLGHPSGG